MVFSCSDGRQTSRRRQMTINIGRNFTQQEAMHENHICDTVNVVDLSWLGIPEEVGSGVAKVTVRMVDWPDQKVLPATVEIRIDN